MSSVSNPPDVAADADPGAATPGAPARIPHPWHFLVLVIPFGVNSGFVGLPITYALTQRHVSSVVIAGLLALSYVPQSWKFLWAPIVDTTFNRKGWYIVSALTTGVGTWLMAWSTDGTVISLSLLTFWVVASSFASTLVGMSIESLMAGVVPDSWRGRVAGWYQAGNLGALGLSSGLALWLMQSAHWSGTTTGLALFALCAVCCLALLGMPTPPTEEHVHESLVAHAVDIFRDLSTVVRSRIGILAIIVCFLPIGTGAAANLWGVVADDWHATADTVALVNGALSGIVSALGCFAGGWICDRIDRKLSDCLFGVAQLLIALVMAYSARTSGQFVVWTTIYAFIQGLTYAGFTAVVLEAIGRTAAATKYSLLASLSNMPIGYVTYIDGVANHSWGSKGMLLTEAAVGLAGVLVFLVVAILARSRNARAAANDSQVASA
ncbi:MAG TPA: MFS transporter [Burkholderiaceae bacterium]|nr:MFS transporter [Burkholderiaceae bacterium]